MMRSLILTAVLFLAASIPLSAAEIKFLNPVTKAEETLRNVTISEEGPQGITVPVAGKPPLKISPLNIRSISYDSKEVQGMEYAAYRKPFAKLDVVALPTTKDDQKPALLKQAFTELQEVIDKLPAKSKLRSHAEYSRIETAMRLIPTDPSFQDEAVKLLSKFRQDHPDGWQIVPCLKTLAELQESMGDVQAVQKTYEELSNVPGLPADVKQDTQFSAARSLMRTE